MKQLTVHQRDLVKQTAINLGVPVDSLEALIRFETAGTFNPQIKNPTSSARGLIQFTDATAKGMGFDDSADLVAHFPDFESQLLGPVYDYLVVHHPFPDDQALFMSVFLPSYKNAPPESAFPSYVTKANPGINTPLDYIKKVWAMAGRPMNTGSTPLVLAALLAGITGFFF